jgi:hypothetical protein
LSLLALLRARFVTRWTKTVALSDGLYRFSGVHDDGMRAYLDNAPVVDVWTFGNAHYSVDKIVTGGTHQLRVEYFEGGGGARAEFTYDRIGDFGEAVPADGGYAAEYFANRDLHGAPVLTRQDAINFEWGGGAPGDGVPADNFSARWTKPVTVAKEGSYKFTVTSDDGVRLFVDGEKVLDKWFPQGPTTYTVTRQLTQGPHQEVLEYFEAGGGAVAKFGYERTSDPPPPPPPPPEPFAAEYFDNSALSGQPVLTRSDDAIDSTGEMAPPARWCRSTSSRRAGRERRPMRRARIGSA